MGLELLDLGRATGRVARRVQDEPGQRVLAALLRRGRDAQQLVAARAERHHVAELEPALGERAGLVEGEGA